MPYSVSLYSELLAVAMAWAFVLLLVVVIVSIFVRRSR